MKSKIPKEWQYPLEGEQLSINWEIKVTEFLRLYGFEYKYFTETKIVCTNEEGKRIEDSKASISRLMYKCGIDVMEPHLSLIEKYL